MKREKTLPEDGGTEARRQGGKEAGTQGAVRIRTHAAPGQRLPLARGPAFTSTNHELRVASHESRLCHLKCRDF